MPSLLQRRCQATGWWLAMLLDNFLVQVAGVPRIRLHQNTNAWNGIATDFRGHNLCGFKPLKHEVHSSNNMHKYSFLTETTLHLHYKDHPVNAVWGNNHCYFESYAKHLSTLCG
jgi:hypothetical protein